MKSKIHTKGWAGLTTSRTKPEATLNSSQREDIQLLTGPVLDDSIAQGECSEAATAWVQITRGKKRVLPRYRFEGGCLYSETPVTSRITFTQNSPKGEFIRVSDQEFFK